MKEIILAHYESPVGTMEIGDLDGKICICDWSAAKQACTINHRMLRYLDATLVEGSTELTDSTVRQLNDYFAGSLHNFEIPVLFAGSEFQCRVWTELMRIGYGMRISYGELSHRIGNAKAVRAVANACASNPLSIIVPCHRVIGVKSELTGYRGGVSAKMYLLDLEARIAGASLPL